MKENKFFSINVKKYDKSRSFEVYYPSSLDRPRSHSVMFVMKRYIEKISSLNEVESCLIFWPEGIEIPNKLIDRHLFVPSKEPRKAYNRFFRDHRITNLPTSGAYHLVDGAMIADEALIGKECQIMPGAYIDNGVRMGDRVYIGSGTRIVGDVTIGNDVVIRENSVIGADGLTTDRDNNGCALTMPQFGGVLIEDDVQIGACTVIARGAIDDTVIGKGSKIDNSCFISHNVVLGENVFIVGETIMMGSSRANPNAYVSGNVTVRNKITIGEEAFIGMGAVVTKNIECGVTVKGNPAK